MKRIAYLTRIVIPVFLILLVGATAVTATVVHVEPVSQTVSAGQNFSVTIAVDDVANMATAGGRLRFDPSALQATRIEEGITSGYAHFFTSENIDEANGEVTFTYSLNPGVNFSGSGPLVTIHFLADLIAEGTHTLSLTDVELYNETEEMPLEAIYNGTITIGSSTPTPTPDGKKSGGGGGSVRITPEPSPTATTALTSTPTTSSTVIPSAATTPTPEVPSETTATPTSAISSPNASTQPKITGFELIFAIIILTVVANLLRNDMLE